ncbi:MAG: hypothetical protein JF601_10255 [Acidobacteria bacterium]|nr:hypothetical protein [Acidobacteriota bacterium]
MTRVLGPAVGVVAVYAVVLAAPFVAPYDPAAQHRDRPLAAPTRVHMVDRDGRFHLRPFVYADDAHGGGAYPLRLFPRSSDEFDASCSGASPDSSAAGSMPR